MGIDLSDMTPPEAAAALADAATYSQETAVTLTYGEQSWQKTPAELGLSLDEKATIATAMAVGRDGTPSTRLQAMFQSWYYGRSVAPVWQLNEGQLAAGLANVAAQLDRPAVSAAVNWNGETAVYTPGQVGRTLDLATLSRQLREPLTDFRQVQVELALNTTTPTVYDNPETAVRLQQLVNNPITFYLQEPLADLDLERVELPQATLNSWLRFELVSDADGTSRYNYLLDENAARQWLSQFADQIDRQPVNARYYFDDDTRELVLVAPHVNGRRLDIEATLAQLKTQLGTPNHAVTSSWKGVRNTPNFKGHRRHGCYHRTG
ncbi:MAG: peptidoglycan binding domain-containing protein [Ardenticatenaceae bacterium]|nr:peptidoglycan binding domain-containing protein [Ardenticatenaceae bacterium]